MRNKHFLGIFLSLALFLLGFGLHGNTSLYFNISGLMIVIGGTSGAALLSFRPSQLANVTRVLFYAYRRPVKKETEIINILVDLSIRSRIDGIISLQKHEHETSILFLRRALGCLVDGYRAEQIRDILNTETYFFRLRREDSERVVRSISNYFPAFGIIGSVVGLITMVGGIGDTSVILTAIPIALTSTLYGLIFANFFFLPFAAKIRERTNHELLLQKIITEGVIAIDSELNPVILKTKLESFLTPSERDTELVPYAKIKERFKIEKQLEDEDLKDLEKSLQSEVSSAGD